MKKFFRLLVALLRQYVPVSCFKIWPLLLRQEAPQSLSADGLMGEIRQFQLLISKLSRVKSLCVDKPP